MSKYVIRNYGEPRQIPCKGGPATILHDGVIETDDPELVAIAGAMDAMNVTTRPNAKGVIPKPPMESSEEIPSGSTQQEIEPLDKMTMAELKAVAKKGGIELPKGIRKAKLVELLLEKN